MAGMRIQAGQKGKRLTQSKEQITKGLNCPAEEWASCIRAEYNSKRGFLRVRDDGIFLPS